MYSDSKSHNTHIHQTIFNPIAHKHCHCLRSNHNPLGLQETSSGDVVACERESGEDGAAVVATGVGGSERLLELCILGRCGRGDG